MKKVLTVLAAGILALFFNSQVIASGYLGKTKSEETASYMAEAIKHAKMAKAHGDNAKKILQQAKMSLKYAEDADDETIENINPQGAEHVTASISHLEEAIKQAEMGHADVASTHIDEALDEMHKYAAKKADYLAK